MLRLTGLILFVLAVMTGVAAGAESKAALVIGNGAYQALPVLSNPANDAADMAVALGRLGYKVTLVRDGDLSTMTDGLRTFLHDAGHADSAVVYYSGHGMQVNGENYLLPVSARIRDQLDVDGQALSLSKLGNLLDAAAPKVKLFILDSCRDNPLLAAGNKSLGGNKGLARVEIAGDGGTLVAYATRPGSVAADGTGRNSPFTTALLARMAAPDIDIRRMFALVRKDVVDATSGAQVPLVDDGIIGDFSLGTGIVADNPPPPPPPVQPPPATPLAVRPLPVVTPPADQQALLKPSTISPSFSCDAVLNEVETRICADAGLAVLDQAVSQAYLARVRPLAGAVRARYAQEQRDWLAQRNACGDDAACLEQRYRERLLALKSSPIPTALAVRPSFDCGGALSQVEQAICADPVLAGLDQKVASQYGRLAAILTGAQRQSLVGDQRQWIGRRNRCGADASCLTMRYGERLSTLAGMQ